MVMLDSSSGYQISVSRLSVAGEDIIERLHALCRYLVGMGVTVVIINEMPKITSDNVEATDPSISYLSDTLIILRYIEVRGEVQKTIGVLKKRTGDYEKSLRSLIITDQGIEVGEPLRGLQGILRGQPRYPWDEEPCGSARRRQSATGADGQNSASAQPAGQS